MHQAGHVFNGIGVVILASIEIDFYEWLWLLWIVQASLKTACTEKQLQSPLLFLRRALFMLVNPKGVVGSLRHACHHCRSVGESSLAAS